VLSAIGFLTYFGEGVSADWSSVYLEGMNFKASPLVSSCGFAVFSVIVAFGRYSSDYLVLWYDRKALLAVFGVIAFLGLVLVFIAAQIGNVYVAVCGFGIAGLGLSIPVPLVISLAAKSPHIKAERAIALVSGYSYFGMTLGPVAFGMTSTLVGNLKWSFLFTAFVLLLIWPFALMLNSTQPPKLTKRKVNETNNKIALPLEFQRQ
jgi:MFS family permease